MFSSPLEKYCVEKGLKMTDQRRLIAQVLSESKDHPDVDSLYKRALKMDPKISIATIYRTLKLFEEINALERHDFGDGKSRYETIPETHHDHLIDIETGQVLEFHDPEIEALKTQIAKRLGFRLVDHRLELYGIALEKNSKK